MLYREQSTTTFPQLSLVISQYLSLLANIYYSIFLLLLAQLKNIINPSGINFALIARKDPSIWIEKASKRQLSDKEISEKLFDKMKIMYIFYYNIEYHKVID